MGLREKEESVFCKPDLFMKPYRDLLQAHIGGMGSVQKDKNNELNSNILSFKTVYTGPAWAFSVSRDDFHE